MFDLEKYFAAPKGGSTDPLDMIRYWLNQIHLSSPNSPIIVVGNRKDKIKNNQQELKLVADTIELLWQQFVIFFLPVVTDLLTNCKRIGSTKIEVIFFAKKKKHVSKIRESIEFIPACAREDAESKLPVASAVDRVRLQAKLRSRRENYISFDHLKIVAKYCSIEEEELPKVIEFLKDTGSIVYFDDPALKLGDIIILNAAWFAKLLSTDVVSWAENSSGKNGIELCGPTRKMSEVEENILGLLEKLGVIGRLEKQPNVLFVPTKGEASNFQNLSVWPIQPPKGKIEYSRTYKWRFLPMGFLNRLLIATYYMSEPVHHIGASGNAFLLLSVNYPDQISYVSFHPSKNKLKIQSRITRTPDFADNKLFNAIVQVIENLFGYNP